MTRTCRWWKALGGAALLGVGQLACAQSPDVSVTVHGIHFAGQLTYRYQVVNNSASAIGGVDLGVLEPNKDLPASPWDADPTFTAVPSPAPASRCKPFRGMACYVAVYQFDYMPAPRSTVQMRADTAILPAHTSSSVAEISVPAPEPGYLTGTASIRFVDNLSNGSDGNPIVELQKPFTKLDTAAPTLSGGATTTKKGTMLAVSVGITVADNLDPNPALVLVSVTSNQQIVVGDVSAVLGADTRSLQVKPYAGRVYYLTYAATDGSDNTATTLITVSASRAPRN